MLGLQRCDGCGQPAEQVALEVWRNAQEIAGRFCRTCVHDRTILGPFARGLIDHFPDRQLAWDRHTPRGGGHYLDLTPANLSNVIERLGRGGSVQVVKEAQP